MVLRQVNLNLEDTHVSLLQARGKNISQLVRSYLNTELELEAENDSPEQILQEAKVHISTITRELHNKSEEVEQLKAELKELKGIKKEEKILHF